MSIKAGLDEDKLQAFRKKKLQLRRFRSHPRALYHHCLPPEAAGLVPVPFGY